MKVIKMLVEIMVGILILINLFMLFIITSQFKHYYVQQNNVTRDKTKEILNYLEENKLAIAEEFEDEEIRKIKKEVILEIINNNAKMFKLLKDNEKPVANFYYRRISYVLNEMYKKVSNS
jgi:uncharacterized membrane protein YgaE (UPF0421/DUF939 family)